MEYLDNMDISQLEDLFLSIGEKKFRAKQLFEWLHQKTVNDFDECTSLSNELRSKLRKDYKLTEISILERLDSKLDETKKYLLKLEDDNIIETVFMKYRYGNSLCISSQVGCKMGCSFCASTKKGLVRNLTVGELLKQIYVVQNDIGEKISHVVIMGSGEPLENFDNVLKFFDIINSDKGQNLSLRRITISTCGIVPKIRELADKNLQITLAISLHAANQEKRKSLMPIANTYDIMDVMKACDYYVEKTNKRITFEYILINGVNDSKEDADELAELLKGKLCNVNLIPYNSIKETDIQTSNKIRIEKFQKTICKSGITAMIRRELGSDINAACGQLRYKYLYD